MGKGWKSILTIISAQAIDHLIVFATATGLLLLVTGPKAHIISELLNTAPLFLSFLIVLFVIGFCYRLVCLVLFNQSLGASMLRIQPRLDFGWAEFVSKLILESMQGSFPFLWILEILARRLSRNFGFDYVHTFR